MRICPKCGGPLIDGDTIVAHRDMSCDRCGWLGSSESTILVDDSLANTSGFQTQLEQLYVGLAHEVAPNIGKLLIENGLVLSPNDSEGAERDRRIQFLAKVLQGATSGIVRGIAGVIAEEMNHGRN